MGKPHDDEAVRNGLKVFVGGLPERTPEHAVGQHFSKYGHVENVTVCPPKEGAEVKKAPYAFVTFRFAADADCAVVDAQNFPGASRPLAMSFAAKKGWENYKDSGSGDPCKVMVNGISDRDNEEEIGDFFSQWGLVALVYRDQGNWGFVRFATKEGANRVLEEERIMFQRRSLEVTKSSESRGISEDDRNDLIHRAVARHFHKKGIQITAPGYYPPGYYPPPGYPPGYPGWGFPAGGYYPPPAIGYYPPASVGSGFEGSMGYYAQAATSEGRSGSGEARYQPY